MTPVEERIDHEVVEEAAAFLELHGALDQGRAVRALLTEHSAREKELRKALEYALEWSTDENGAPAGAWRNVAREAFALPATEPAQPEEER